MLGYKTQSDYHLFTKLWKILARQAKLKIIISRRYSNRKSALQYPAVEQYPLKDFKDAQRFIHFKPETILQLSFN